MLELSTRKTTPLWIESKDDQSWMIYLRRLLRKQVHVYTRQGPWRTNEFKSSHIDLVMTINALIKGTRKSTHMSREPQKGVNLYLSYRVNSLLTQITDPVTIQIAPTSVTKIQHYGITIVR